MVKLLLILACAPTIQAGIKTTQSSLPIIVSRNQVGLMNGVGRGPADGGGDMVGNLSGNGSSSQLGVGISFKLLSGNGQTGALQFPKTFTFSKDNTYRELTRKIEGIIKLYSQKSMYELDSFDARSNRLSSKVKLEVGRYNSAEKTDKSRNTIKMVLRMIIKGEHNFYLKNKALLNAPQSVIEIQKDELNAQYNKSLNQLAGVAVNRNTFDSSDSKEVLKAKVSYIYMFDSMVLKSKGLFAKVEDLKARSGNLSKEQLSDDFKELIDIIRSSGNIEN